MRQLIFPFAARAHYGWEDFVVSPANAQSFAAVTAWPDWPAYAFILTGNMASGKTHLARIWQQQSNALELFPEDITRQRDFTQVGCPVLVERADSIADDTGFFHFLNTMREHQYSVLLTSRLPLSQWPQRLPDLTSRLKALPALVLDPPDDALLSGILRKYFHDRQMTLPDTVVEYLLPRVERSFAAIEDLAARLDRLSLEGKRPVSVKLAREALAVEEPT